MSRRAARLLAVATAGATVVLTAMPASAAPPKVITLAQAAQLLPAEKQLPTHMRLELLAQTPHLADVEACIETAQGIDVRLSASQATGLYVTSDFPPDAMPLSWQVSAAVFHDAKKAAAGMAAIIKAERACPARLAASATGDGTSDAGTANVHRALRQRYDVSGWQGYRTADTVTASFPGGGPGFGERLQDVLLQKGNIVLHVQEVAFDLPGTRAKQDRYRSQVTRLVVDAFDNASKG